MPTSQDYQKLRSAIEVLQDHLYVQLEQVQLTKATISGLYKHMGEQEPVLNGSSGVTDKEPRSGKALATAVKEYLMKRRTPALVAEILAGLKQAKFNFSGLGWKPDKQERLLERSLARNSRDFRRTGDKTFGLSSWFGQTTTTRRSHRKTDGSSSGDGGLE